MMATAQPRKKKKPALSGKKGASRSSQLNRSHLNHPAGYRVGGEALATLREVIDPSVPTLSFGELSEQQLADLVVARLQAKPEDYSISMIGPGAMNKARAIAEVQARSKIGRTLIEIEQLLITALATGAEGAR